MPWPKQQTIDEKLAAVVDEEVRRIAAASEWSREVDHEFHDRLAKCLTEKIMAFSPTLASRPAALRLEFQAWPLRVVGEAFGDLPPARALELVEVEDIEMLSRRVQACEAIASPEAPFYRREELQSNLTAFADFLEAHREYLVLTGLPPRYFRACRWLHVQLGRLYDTRLTHSAFCMDELFGDRDLVSEHEPYGFALSHEDGRSLKSPECCDYEEAGFLDGLDDDDGRRLEALRPQVFAAKLAVVRQLIGDAPAVDGLNSALAELTKHLSKDEIAYLLRMDQWYLGSDIAPVSEGTASETWSPGGLTNLLAVIGRVEAERRFGAFHESSCGDGEILRRAIDADATQDEPNSWWRYFGWCKRFDRLVIDAALDGYLIRRVEEEPLWIEIDQWAASCTAANAPTKVPCTPADPKVGRRRKKSSRRGEGQDKCESALLTHHGYNNGAIENHSPVGSNELARMADVSPSTANAFFNKQFRSYSNYRSECGTNRRLLATLWKLSGEGIPSRTLSELDIDDPAPEVDVED